MQDLRQPVPPVEHNPVRMLDPVRYSEGTADDGGRREEEAQGAEGETKDATGMVQRGPGRNQRIPPGRG